MVFKNLIITGALPGRAGSAWTARGYPRLGRGDRQAGGPSIPVPQPGDLGYETYPNPEETQDRSGCQRVVDHGAGRPTRHPLRTARRPQRPRRRLRALRRLAGGARRQYRQAEMAPPTDPQGHLGLGHVDPAGPGRRQGDGKTIPVIVQSGKAGFVFIFERETGKAVYEVKETPTPRANQPGDIAWPTQPIPATDPVARQNMTRDQIPDVYPGQEGLLHQVLGRQQDRQPWSVRPAAARPRHDPLPDHHGRSELGPAARHDPTSGLYIVNAQNMGTYRSRRLSGPRLRPRSARARRCPGGPATPSSRRR